MTEVFSAEKIDPSKLSEQQREELSKRLYRIHTAVFTGLNELEFDQYLVNSPAQATRILLYRNKQKALIGYFGVHRFEKYIGEQPVWVFRGEVGILPAYRQRDASVCFWMLESAKFKLLNPLKKVYFLAAPVNPSSYAMLAGHTRLLYPRHDLSISADVLQLMSQLAQQFNLAQVVEGNELLRKVGWITQPTDQERTFWYSTQNPHVRFYIENNSGFSQGYGLLTLIPLTISNSLLSLADLGFHAFKKWLRVKLRA